MPTGPMRLPGSTTVVRDARPQPIGPFLLPWRPWLDLWSQRELIWQMTRREIASRYRGSVLGSAWALLQPLIMLAVYTFAFAVVFRARWGARLDESRSGFALALFAGLIVFNVLSDVANRAPTAILSQPNYVRKVVFPLHVIPVSLSLSALFFAAVNTLLLLLFVLVFNHAIGWTALLFVPVLLTMGVFSLGMAFLLASLGVYLRDTAMVVTALIQILFFTAPVFFPVTAVPEPFAIVVRANPLTPLLESARQTLLWGQQPDWGGLGASVIIAAVVLQFGYAWFQKTRRGFADVL